MYVAYQIDYFYKKFIKLRVSEKKIMEVKPNKSWKRIKESQNIKLLVLKMNE